MMAVETKASGDRIVIAGGGIAGLSLALALKQALGAAFSVVLADPALATPVRNDNRAYAVAAAAQAMLQALGIWEAVAATAQPMTEMIVSDSRNGDAVRPVFLTFDGEVEPGQPFAHMVENRAADGPARSRHCGRRRVQAGGRAPLRE
jgi:2-octaprenyl-6-methoxyphenol hydroxylase